MSPYIVSVKQGDVLDLGGPDGGRYWRVVSGHQVDHRDVHAAAVHARVTGSVGCTYNDAKVDRAAGPSRQAVATLDEARQYISDTLINRGVEDGWTFSEAERLESGGSVSLPDGTEIEVERVTRGDLLDVIGSAHKDWEKTDTKDLVRLYNEAQSEGVR